MEIIHEHHTSNGAFYVLDEHHKKLAVMTYVMVNETTLLIEHTIVEAALNGQGIGKKLVHAGVQYALEKGYKIIPQCPYANAVFQKTPEYDTVFKK